MWIVLLINATLDLIQARAALEGLPFECTATRRFGRSVDKSHLPAALRADKPVINTDGVWLFRGHNSSRNFRGRERDSFLSRPTPGAKRPYSDVLMCPRWGPGSMRQIKTSRECEMRTLPQNVPS